MFDILPESAAPSDVDLTEELRKAKDRCRQIFLELPVSVERNSILGALGRIGKASLKHKIRYRSQNILDVIGSKFPEIHTVIDEAVICRNHYVHGSDPSFDYNTNFDSVQFFTDTLEFIFAASDLVEAGWDVAAWCAKPTSMSHPFGRYRATYFESLGQLKKLL